MTGRPRPATARRAAAPGCRTRALRATARSRPRCSPARAAPTRRSISAIASPVVVPGAGLPWIWIAARRCSGKAPAPVIPAAFGKVGKRHQPAAGVAHAPLVDVRGGGARLGLALDIDALDPALVEKIVHVAARPGDLQELAHIRRRQPHGPRLAPVDVEVELRRVLQPAGPGRRDQVTLRGHPQKAVARLDEVLVRLPPRACR